MADTVTTFEDGKLTRYIRESILAYLEDRPDTEFQAGYLAALLDLYREVLGRHGDDRIDLAAKLIYPNG